MRAGTYAQIFLVPPIGEIMPAFLAGSGMVGNLISRESCCCADILGNVIHVRRHLFLQQAQPAPVIGIVKSGALFNGKLIQRQMVHRQLQSLLQFLFPVGQALSHAGINQIKTVTPEIFLRQVDGRPGLGNVMFPAQRLEIHISEGLNAKRHPVNPGSRKIPEFVRFHAGGIGFQSNFYCLLQLPVIPNTLQNPPDSGRRHQGRCTASKKNTGDPARPGKSGKIIKFPAQRLGPGCFVNAGAHMTVKITIRTFGPAKRPMHIHRKRRHLGFMRFQSRP
tara:strand:- start:6158 stop:6991 length:834 start_codon:yes stop_codon:yes gene_type:complete